MCPRCHSVKEHYSSAKPLSRIISRNRPATVHAKGSHDIPMVNVNNVALVSPTSSNEQPTPPRQEHTNERKKAFLGGDLSHFSRSVSPRQQTRKGSMIPMLGRTWKSDEGQREPIPNSLNVPM
ncbi:hypothetical protein Aduo_006473 [Ancylostoma duodenale]